MKKTYLQPLTEVAEIESTTMICASDGVTSSNGIDYGGVDEDGEMNPAARRHRDMWEEEEEEEW